MQTMMRMPMHASSPYNNYNGVSRGVSVHSTIIMCGYLGTVVSTLFAVFVVLIAPGPVDPATGSLRYISDGMEAHCGLATAVFGTCSLLLFGCQLMVCAHIESQWGLGLALIQGAGWNVVLGVADTGWTVHYVGLGLFLLSNLALNGLVSHDCEFGGRVYRCVHSMACLSALLFGILAVISLSTDNDPTTQSLAVAFEFVMLLALSAQNLCLVGALDRFDDIHIQFLLPPPHTNSIM
jgi:hypothetical protein